MSNSPKEEPKAQTQLEIREKIMSASKRKILRRQMELLAEYSRVPSGRDKIPESSEAMVLVHKELIKAECFLLMRIFVAFFSLIYLLKRVSVKRIEFIKR